MELRRKIGIVFQDPDSQLFSTSVYQGISFGPLLARSKNFLKQRMSEKK
ncbi:cobalt ABC transporter, ATPase subunit domain protein [Desulfosporosinus sp. OT]|nr:cobalt ABC transporter, ATPase subunit domain protein [Desulfosporosinus sp. OT]